MSILILYKSGRSPPSGLNTLNNPNDLHNLIRQPFISLLKISNSLKVLNIKKSSNPKVISFLYGFDKL